jgi:Ferritin-like
VTKGYAGHGGGTLFAVTDPDSALLAIEVIVEQGEGTHTSAPAPVGFDGTTRPTHLKLEPFGFQGLRNHAEKPIALALLGEAWPDGSGEVAGPPFAWDPMPLDEMRRLARRLGTVFDLGPTVETLDQVSALLPTDR